MRKLLLILAVVAALPSCTKYDEGPFMSLRTKRQRIIKDWKAVVAETENGDVTSYMDIFWNFDESGTHLRGFEHGSGDQVLGMKGIWFLNSDKTRIVVEWGDNYGGQTESFTILKLFDKEMWLKDKDNNRIELIKR